MNRTVYLAAFLLLSVESMMADEPKVEAWSDPRLRITSGLEYWFDASRVSGDQAIPSDGKIAIWHDASGNERHLQQQNVEYQPSRLPLGDGAVVRFDGEGDVLRFTQGPPEREQLTLFVMAAPRRNHGGFRAVLALNAPDQRDFESGLTVDFGPFQTTQFTNLNVEGKGFGTWRSLLTGARSYGELYALEIVISPNRVSLFVDGELTGERPRSGSPVSLAEFTAGARYYSLGGPQAVQGFGAWDIAEVLVYGRSHSADETTAIRKYLADKYASVRRSLPPDLESGATMLEPVKNPPAIQTLLPGFSAEELPVDLTNINNVLYRSDGTLMALAYNGTIWKLRDTDGDALENSAELFWDSHGSLSSPIGIDVTPPGYAHGDGVFVVSKSRCVLIVDTDQDGKADREIVVADGWQESLHQVDGLGVAYDQRDGSIYFGRGTYNFTDPLLKDKDGKPQYKLTDESGAVMRVSPDFKTREIIATGIRFPVGLRFNRQGDLFATDQEGATWVPNGNPFDELLHIQKGRHYGFPANDGVHVTGVVDEPSVFDYAPQHQSTCGFNFNDPVAVGGPTFGPSRWDGDAFVTGESRGKLYRTSLVKTPAGYVAQTQLFACLSMLTVDCCIAPDGSLRVACHSGGPDWGSGPTGKGKLFKIRYAAPDLPQPAVVWTSGPREVRVEFDRPVDPERLRDAFQQIKLTAGSHVRAGDRFESIWPGYAVVQTQKFARRYDIPVRSVQLTPDHRTLVLATDPLTTAMHYALTLPGIGRPALDQVPTIEIAQHPEIDLDFDLTGCEATWVPEGGGSSWTGWVPHPDLEASRAFTRGSSHHDALWLAMNEAGTLTLRAQLDLSQLLHPAVQPGSRLDYPYPQETVTVTFESTSELRLVASVGNSIAGRKVSFTLTPEQDRLVPLELQLQTGGGSAASLRVSFTTNEDDHPRVLPLRRFLLPWAESESDSLGKEPLVIEIPELEGGSWARGRALFFGERANCSKCHTVHGRGGALGPELSNLIHRDYASVLRDITNPSFAINPDHLAYTVETKDGRVLSGVMRTLEDRLQIGNSEGEVTEVARADVESVVASSVSAMPEGVHKILGPEQMRDLLTFLLTRTPAMPDYGANDPPPPRLRSEVAAVLAGAPDPPLTTRPMRVVLVSGRKDHGPGEHDYPAWQKSWSELLGIAENTAVETAADWPSEQQFQTADVLVFYQQGSWSAERAKDMDTFLGRGRGAVYIHYAVDGGADAPGFAQRIGLAWQGGRSKFRHGMLELGFETGENHPIGRNFKKVQLHDESYWQLTGDPKTIRLLAKGTEDGADQPLFWTCEPSGGHVVVSIPGHFAWTFDDPLFRVLLLRGIAWAAGEPVDRFNDLVLPGARVRD
jgi:putative heme-binding domain-containing protein